VTAVAAVAATACVQPAAFSVLAGWRALDRPQQHLPAVHVPGAAAPLARQPLRFRRPSRVPRPFFAKPTPFPSISEDQEVKDEKNEDQETKGGSSVSTSSNASSGLSGGRAPQDLSDFQNLPPDELVTGIVTQITKYGLRMEALPPNGGPACTALLHISELKDSFVTQEELEEEFHIGQEIEARVISANMEDGRLRLSIRPVRKASVIEARTASDANADRADMRESLKCLAELPPGTWVKAEVKRLLAFGMLVEVAPPNGGVNVTGLLHISRVKRGFVTSELLQTQFTKGQELSVRIEEVDMNNSKVSLSLINKSRKVDYEAMKAVPDDQWFVGSVVHTEDYGILVSANINGQDVSGRVHRAQVDPLRKAGLGDVVQVRVISVDVESERVTFSMLNMTLWNISAFEGLPSDQLLNAQIESKVNFGAFAVVQHPSGQHVWRALLAKSVLRKEFDNLEEGQKVKVLVSHVDVSEGRMSAALPARSAPPATIDLDDDMDDDEEDTTLGFLDDLDHLSKLLGKDGLGSYKAQLLAQGYDSVKLLKCLNAEEWTEMRKVCGLRPGDAAKLRQALGRE